MNDDLNKKWEVFLNPETLRSNIIWASIFITGYELLKQNIIDNLRYFFANFGFLFSDLCVKEYCLRFLKLRFEKSPYHNLLLATKWRSRCTAVAEVR